MWDIPRLYVSACSNSVQLVPFQPIMISILFHHFKELKECMREVEKIRGDKKVNNNNDNNNHNNCSISGSGIIVMMTEQEKPLETYDEMVQEMEEELSTNSLDGLIFS
jgi:hypothetical protein